MTCRAGWPSCYVGVDVYITNGGDEIEYYFCEACYPLAFREYSSRLLTSGQEKIVVRYVHVGAQVKDGAEQFAFYDTVAEEFITVGVSQVFDSVDDFLEEAELGGASREFTERCRRLIPGQSDEEVVLYRNPAHPDACKVLGCHEKASHSYEEPMFGTERGAASPYRNQTAAYCEIHGEHFEQERRDSARLRRVLDGRRERCTRWIE